VANYTESMIAQYLAHLNGLDLPRGHRRRLKCQIEKVQLQLRHPRNFSVQRLPGVIHRADLHEVANAV
jgi:hypothetical protein